MIKEALQYITGLSNTRIENINGQIYSTQPMTRLAAPVGEDIKVNSLTGFVDYVKSEYDLKEKLMIHVVSPTEVVALTKFNRDFNRNELIRASALIPSFRFDQWHDAENFNIKLQSGFVKNEDRDIMLKVVGNIKEESVNTYGDDGVAQSVVAKAGIGTVANVKVPNPVILAPYRTFTEVTQPESEFVFRMQSGPRCALFEADGGAWKSEAMLKIKTYLETFLEKEIEQNKVIVIA